MIYIFNLCHCYIYFGFDWSHQRHHDLQGPFYNAASWPLT